MGTPPQSDLSLGRRKLVQANPNTSTRRIGLPKHRLDKNGMASDHDFEIYETTWRGQRAYVIPIPETYGSWRKRKIEVFPQYDRIEGTAEDDNGNTVVLGMPMASDLTNSHTST